MTLGRLAVAWVIVALWFGLATYLTSYLAAATTVPPGSTPFAAVPFTLLKRRLIEAALVTLIGSLWFDSLGAGGWWLLFLLIGALTTVTSWYRSSNDLPRKAVLVVVIGELAQYVIGGALLAWRLS